jgi:hypothetical protein
VSVRVVKRAATATTTTTKNSHKPTTKLAQAVHKLATTTQDHPGTGTGAEPAQEHVMEVIKGRYEFIGEKSLIFNIPRTATCVALCACSVLILTLDKYEQILEAFPEYREKNVREWMFTRGGARPVSMATTVALAASIHKAPRIMKG